ncbi:hypothetical protein GWK47_007767 [Chionoecetes opilio]|uniref:Uncharacterized protein n=1 Tax=Chionoecetes opilio TaxID=41210 RepID=A0A8J5CPY8_CHIOP|nr:hypothetical protein GWK47_007767 [Chionoecetes opilio]
MAPRISPPWEKNRPKGQEAPGVPAQWEEGEEGENSGEGLMPLIPPTGGGGKRRRRRTSRAQTAPKTRARGRKKVMLLRSKAGVPPDTTGRIWWRGFSSCPRAPDTLCKPCPGPISCPPDLPAQYPHDSGKPTSGALERKTPPLRGKKRNGWWTPRSHEGQPGLLGGAGGEVSAPVTGDPFKRFVSDTLLFLPLRRVPGDARQIVDIGWATQGVLTSGAGPGPSTAPKPPRPLPPNSPPNTTPLRQHIFLHAGLPESPKWRMGVASIPSSPPSPPSHYALSG